MLFRAGFDAQKDGRDRLGWCVDAAWNDFDSQWMGEGRRARTAVLFGLVSANTLEQIMKTRMVDRGAFVWRILAGRGSLRGVLRFVAAGVVLHVGLTGCSNMHAPHPVGRTTGGAVRCDKCRTTWVARAEPFGKLTRYSKQEAMVCEDCESAVEHWMKTGDLRHYCSHCKGHMSCEPEQRK